MTKIHIKGGVSLQGSVTIVPNKNAVLPALLASILTKEKMTYQNVPDSPDVKKILAALELMGATVEHKKNNVVICCKNLTTHVVPYEYIREMQAGYLFAGPLLARFKEASIPPSSGCQLGYRGYEEHAEYFRKLGVETSLKEIDGQKYVHFEQTNSTEDHRSVCTANEPLYEKRYVSYSSASVTPTENILMFLAGANSRFDTEISGIAQEPHIAQLIDLLRKMDVQIKGKGSTIKIRNNGKITGAIFTPGPDHVDYFGFVVTAAMTKSDIRLNLPVTNYIHHINEFIAAVGIVIEVHDDHVIVKGSQSSYKPCDTFPRASNALSYKMNPGPWPMFPVDCLPSFVAWSTVNPDPATLTISNNWLYDDGMKYVPVLQQMGARIPVIDPQRATVLGSEIFPYRSSNLEVIAPNVIEGVRAIISCALSGGEYTINSAHYILRRNPEFFDVLKKLGADITVLD